MATMEHLPAEIISSICYWENKLIEEEEEQEEEEKFDETDCSGYETSSHSLHSSDII
jgi:hypothetical protein